MEQVYLAYLNGLITENEAHEFFDQIQIRGQFNGLEFIGHDYRYQEWVYLTPDTIH